ncbi:MAG: hypothetical protein K9M99_02415 [Candidatus Cloacimonetes bacterium]|nr:hypothetical protein [Candidatus Cloacimonadota bacterium]
MKIGGIIFKYLFLVVLCLFFWNVINQYEYILHQLKFADYVDLVISGGFFIVLYLLFLHKIMDFWETFAHELTHLLFALITFNKIEGFSATDNGGAVSYRGRSNWLTSLSPYFFPIYTTFFVVLSLVINQRYQVYINHLIVISYLFFLMTLVQQFSYSQSDISKSGYVFSTIFVFIMNVLILLFIVFHLGGKLPEFGHVMQSGLNVKRLISFLS